MEAPGARLPEVENDRMRMSRMTKLLAPLSWAILLASTAHAQPAPERMALPNGLRVTLWPLDNASSVAVVTLIDVGERHDPPGRSGLAHAMEHLLVTCATDVSKPTHADALFARYGGQFNAQTGEDYTLLAGVVAPDDLHEELRLAAARLKALKITQADLDRELPRLELELRNMHEAMPALALSSAAKAAALPLQRGARKGGVIEDLRALAAEDYRERLREVYGASTSRLTVVGRFDLDATKRTIELLFGDVPPAAPPGAPSPRAERRQTPQVLPALTGAPGEIRVAFAMPGRTSPHFGASVIIANRLSERWPREEGTQFPVVWQPIEQPEVLTLTLALAPGEAIESGIERLDDLVRDIALARLSSADAFKTAMRYGQFLGATPIPALIAAQNPYFAAVVIARSEQLGVPPDHLTRAIRETTHDDILACYERVFSPKVRGVAARPHAP